MEQIITIYEEGGYYDIGLSYVFRLIHPFIKKFIVFGPKILGGYNGESAPVICSDILGINDVSFWIENKDVCEDTLERGIFTTTMFQSNLILALTIIWSILKIKRIFLS